MLFNPHTVIFNRETGKPLQERRNDPEKGPEAITVTHGLLVCRALDAKYEDEKTLSPKEGYTRFLLASRIMGAERGETVDLTIEEAKLVKDLTAKAYPSGIFGQIWLALDEAAKAPAAKPNGAAEAHP